MSKKWTMEYGQAMDIFARATLRHSCDYGRKVQKGKETQPNRNTSKRPAPAQSSRPMLKETRNTMMGWDRCQLFLWWATRGWWWCDVVIGGLQSQSNRDCLFGRYWLLVVGGRTHTVGRTRRRFGVRVRVRARLAGGVPGRWPGRAAVVGLNQRVY